MSTSSFRYRVRDAQGYCRRGTLPARDARHARQLLRARGFQVLRLRPAWGLASLFGAPTLAVGDRVLLPRQLATLLQAGLPLADALRAVAAQSEKRAVQQVLLAVVERLGEGQSLAAALGQAPQAFTPAYCATVAAAERSGHLAAAFEQLAEHTENQQVAHQRIRLALVYPTILVCASLAIVAFLLGFVVPDVVQVFAHNHQQLPAMTRVLMAVSEAAQRFGLPLLGVLLVAGLCARIAVRAPKCRLRWHGLLLRLPVCGALIRASEAARAIRTLAILVRSGVTLVDALGIAAGVIGNQMLRQRLQTVAQAVSEGTTLARSLEQSDTLPPLMLHMIASAERAGDLEHMLERAAQLQERLLGGRIALALSLFEPLMLVVMGAVVLFIVLAILMPILNLNQLVT